jgi:hypothetical protein
MVTNDMEALFVNCIEQVRKEIIKRRLQAEVMARRKGGPLKANLNQNSSYLSASDSQAGEFEETLAKLADLAKGKVKLDEFTKQDSVRLLDLFVNNEQTLLKMYEYLFPNQSFKSRQALKNPSDLIKLNENSTVGLNDTMTEATLNMSPIPSNNQTIFANQKSLNDALDNSAFLNESEASAMKAR